MTTKGSRAWVPLLWTFCELFRDEYAEANTKQEQEAVQRRVVEAIKEEGLGFRQIGENGELVSVGDGVVAAQTKSYFDAPEDIKDRFKELFEKLGVAKGCKVFDFLCKNKIRDMCVFIIFCSINRRDYLWSTNPNYREWIKQRTFTVAKQTGMDFSKIQEDGSIAVMDDEAVMIKIPEFIFKLEEDESEACIPFIGDVGVQKLGMLTLAKVQYNQQHWPGGTQNVTHK